MKWQICLSLSTYIYIYELDFKFISKPPLANLYAHVAYHCASCNVQPHKPSPKLKSMDTAGRNGELTRWSRPATCARSIKGDIHLRHKKIYYTQAMRLHSLCMHIYTILKMDLCACVNRMSFCFLKSPCNIT